jgi:hypothetical protein
LGSDSQKIDILPKNQEKNAEILYAEILYAEILYAEILYAEILYAPLKILCQNSLSAYVMTNSFSRRSQISETDLIITEM